MSQPAVSQSVASAYAFPLVTSASLTVNLGVGGWWLNWLVPQEGWHFISLSLRCLDSTGLSFPCSVASHPLILSGLAPLLSSASSQALCFFHIPLNMPTHSPNKHACPFPWSFLACRGPSQLPLYIQIWLTLGPSSSSTSSVEAIFMNFN